MRSFLERIAQLETPAVCEAPYLGMPSSTMLMDDYLLRDEILYIAEQRSIRRIAQWHRSETAELECVCPIIRDGSDGDVPATQAGAPPHHRAEPATAGGGANGRGA